ncbi:collagenase-like [Eurosta solidaginis]|uniref:collagenase-like n=1 Tax=Eurosta solidaginis TaxID=178769 RepID=UPI003530ED5A
MNVLLCLIFVVATATAGPPGIYDKFFNTKSLPILDGHPESRITNGKDAADGQFPYQVFLNFTQVENRKYYCGGVLISNDYVLTGAHCTYNATVVTVVLGTTQFTSPLVTRTVNSSNFIVNPKFSYDIYGNDIALIKIPPVSFNHYINKVRLPAITATPSTYDGQTAIVSGWGFLNNNATRLSPKLQSATLQVISNIVCDQFYTHEIFPDILCTSTVNGTSACNGDSGGPLTEVSTGELIGTFSFVPDSGCGTGEPSGYTRVTYYLDWIKEHSGVYY